MRACARVVLACFTGIALLSVQGGALRAQQSNSDWTAEDKKEVLAYQLNMDKIKRIFAASKDLKDWQVKNPDAAKQMQTEEGEGSITSNAKAIDAKFPAAAAILKKNGMETREFLVGLYVLFASVNLVGMKKSGEIKDYSAANGTIHPANLTFVESHLDEIEKLMPTDQPQ